MDVVVGLVTVVLLAAVIALISHPLRLARRGPEGPSEDRADLEAARESKYREIRDAQLDYSTGKLSDSDYEAVDGALRAEAMDILRRLDGVDEAEAAEAAADPLPPPLAPPSPPDENS
jgi:hypothetical protein